MSVFRQGKAGESTFQGTTVATDMTRPKPTEVHQVSLNTAITIRGSNCLVVFTTTSTFVMHSDTS